MDDAFKHWQRTKRAAESRLRAILVREHVESEAEANAQPLRRLPSKTAQVNAAKSFKYLARHSKAGRVSMVNMPAPAGHQVSPRFPSERERAMFAAHERRKASGWIHG